MARRNKKTVVSESGFTLIELLVVISIISVLASIITATFSVTKTNAKNVARLAEIRQLQKAVETYYSDTGRYPVITDTQGNAGEGAINGDDATTAIESILYPAYMADLPRGRGSAYYYESDGSQYCIAVTLDVTTQVAGLNGYCLNSGNNIGISQSLVLYTVQAYAIGNVTSWLGC